jgi:NADH-quinone oxidoreductase subunit E
MVAESAPAVETPSPPVSEWGTRTPPAAPADLGQAVAAAQSAVEAALIRSGIDPGAPAVRDSAAFGKPDPMKSPLGGGRDDLKLIDGLRAEDELMLNGIGIFHFGQIAEWDHKEILWLENHILERGRISRENWQAQAAELIRRRAEETRQVGA